MTAVPATIKPSLRFGHLEVLSADTTSKRIACRCSCGQVRIVAIDALLCGVRASCGCAPISSEHRRAFSEAQSQRQSQRDYAWRR
jgi:hypothetical protein